MVAVMKRRVRDHIDRENDATTGAELFKAMVAGNPLKGVSVHYVKLENSNQQTKKPTIAGISYCYDFKYEQNGDVRVWNYYGNI